MNYHVIVPATAEEELAAVWNAAADRNAVPAAMDDIERRLGRDPLTFGESRTGNERIVFHGPLAVYYRVEKGQREVRILSIAPAGSKQ